MIYLIGGPAKVGKTILAQRLAAELKVGWLPLDTIRFVLRRELPAAPNDGLPTAAIKDTVESSAYIALNYIIEGADLTPQHVREFGRDFEVEACFIGMSRVDRDVLTAHSPTPWHLDRPIEEQDALMLSIESRSSALAAECAALGIPYFDLAQDYLAQASRALRSLISQQMSAGGWP